MRQTDRETDRESERPHQRRRRTIVLDEGTLVHEKHRRIRLHSESFGERRLHASVDLSNSNFALEFVGEFLPRWFQGFAVSTPGSVARWVGERRRGRGREKLKESETFWLWWCYPPGWQSQRRERSRRTDGRQRHRQNDRQRESLSLSLATPDTRAPQAAGPTLDANAHFHKPRSSVLDVLVERIPLELLNHHVLFGLCCCLQGGSCVDSLQVGTSCGHQNETK